MIDEMKEYREYLSHLNELNTKDKIITLANYIEEINVNMSHYEFLITDLEERIDFLEEKIRFMELHSCCEDETHQHPHQEELPV